MWTSFTKGVMPLKKLFITEQKNICGANMIYFKDCFIIWVVIILHFSNIEKQVSY